MLLTDGNGDTVYTVGVPYLYDAEYNVSYDVEVTVSQTGSVCRITYSPDREWMFSDERVYPVVLDPTITSGEYAANIVDTYVTQADSNNHSGEGNLVVGIKSGKINRAYIKISNLPAIPAGVTPLTAQLLIKHGANTTTGRTMSLYYAGSSWNQSTITYTNQPSASTFIRSCAFNTSNVLFSFNPSQIQTLYQKSGSNTNYGFQLRYSSESTTNPDYNMLRSMEYPTASEKPCFTVNYGYSLPESLSAGEIYLFKNADSGKYMDVQNGTDANDTNVIQWGWNGSAAQQFKLELSSTGNGYILRSQVGGKTRVLDIYKTNGRVENGNNVQIYTNIDPKAQEWLILPVDATKFRIVPRSNPALSLTSYGSSNGTADGRTTTSAGNVFVSTYTGATNQLWEIYDTDRNRISNDFIGILSHGKYYMINRYSSRFIKNVGNMVYVRDGFTDLAMFSNEWLITQTDSGKYCIQPANRSDLFLCGDTETQTVGLYGSPVSYWDYTNAPQAGPLLYITSGGTQYALAESDGELVLQPRLTQPGTEEYFSQSWRFISVGSYVALSSVSFSDLSVDVGESVNANIASKNPTNASLTLITDFTYEVDENSPQDIVSVNNVTGYFTGEKAGYVSIIATHKSSGITSFFEVEVTPLLIYQTRNRERLGFADASNDLDTTVITPEDLLYSDKSKEQLINGNLMISNSDLYDLNGQISIARRVQIMKDFYHSQINYDPEFTIILDDMIDHFVSGSGTDYTNDALSEAVIENEASTAYVSGVKERVAYLLNRYAGNIGALYYDSDLWINPIERKQQPMVWALLGKDKGGCQEFSFLAEPSFGSNCGNPGLSLGIDSLYGNKIEVLSYAQSENSYTGELQFTYYDHFGLDADDLISEKSNGYVSLRPGTIPAFRQFYILQHWNSLILNSTYPNHPKPFLTTITFTVAFSGVIS